MADNSVFIAGVADGAFEKALGELPPWATEGTLDDIKDLLKKSYGIQTRVLSESLKKSLASGRLDPEEAKKVNDELSKLNRQIVKLNEDSAKTHKRNKDLEKTDKEDLSRGRKLNTGSEKLTYVLTGLAAVGSKVLGAQTDYIDVYDSLYKSGINVLNGNNSTADGFEALNQLVNQTGLRLQTLQKVAEKYSTTMNVVGMSKFGKAVAMSTTRMNELGFSQEESAELTAAMLESEKGYSDVRSKSASQISADSLKLAQQFGRLSQTVGISRQQLLDNLQKAAKTSESTMVAARHGEKAAESVAKAVAGFKDDSISDMFLKMSASIDPIFTQMGKTFQMAGMGGLGTQIGRLSKDMQSMDPIAAQRSFESIVGSITPGDIDALNARIAAGDSDAAAALDMITKFQQHVRGLSKATEGQQSAATKTEASIARLQTQTEKLSAVTQAAFYPMVEQVNMVAGAMELLNNALYGAIGAVNAETRSWIGAGIAIAGFAAGILGMTKTVGTFLSLFGKAGATVSSAVSGLGSIFLRFAGPVAALYAAFQLGTAIGETIMEAITGVKTSIDYIEIIGQILGDIGGWFSEQFTSLGKMVSGAVDNLKIGLNKIYEFAPWIKTLVDFVSTFVKGVISKFANKMSFGLVGSDTSDFVDTPLKNQSAAESARLSRISVPTAPMASTIASPSAVEVQPPKVPDSGTLPTAQSTVAAMAKPDNKADINSMLSFQSNLLEQILLSSTRLVSVNQEILRFTRNNA